MHFSGSGRKGFVLLLIALILPAGTGRAGGLKLKGAGRGYQVQASLDRYPLSLGENRLMIEIRDESGRSVNDAVVLVNYYMPPMPRMVPMNYTTQADPKGLRYQASLKIIMEGPWYIKIVIKQGEKAGTVRFNVDAQ